MSPVCPVNLMEGTSGTIDLVSVLHPVNEADDTLMFLSATGSSLSHPEMISKKKCCYK